jgi:hypothetical protein
MPITFGRKGRSYLCSQTTGGAESVVPLHVDIPCTGRRGFDLPLQEYLKFPYKYFLSVVLPFKGYCYKLCPSNNPRRKNHKDIKIR